MGPFVSVTNIIMSNVWGNLLNKEKPVELMFSSKETFLLKKIMNKLLINI